jgi:hypothetical protein
MKYFFLKLIAKFIIPKGIYCYDKKICPFWDIQEYNARGTAEAGYCHYLGYGDNDCEYVSLLFDQCKECGINEYDLELLKFEVENE